MSELRNAGGGGGGGNGKDSRNVLQLVSSPQPQWAETGNPGGSHPSSGNTDTSHQQGKYATEKNISQWQ